MTINMQPQLNYGSQCKGIVINVGNILLVICLVQYKNDSFKSVNVKLSQNSEKMASIDSF